MTIEENIFKRYSSDFDKLQKYGFIKTNKGFKIEKLFYNNSFKAIIMVDLESRVSGTVFDLENEDEFLPLRIKNNHGIFVSEIKAAYEDLLTEIRDNCFAKKYYIFPQSNRITNLIIKKYGDEPEFLWKKPPDQAFLEILKLRNGILQF